MKKIFLASTSPRRREIMKLAGLDFEVISPDCDENIDTKDPGEYVSELSLRKASAGLEFVRKRILLPSEDIVDQKESEPEDFDSGCFVIGSDTIVVFNGNILGKPHDKDQAFEMLGELSGNTHTVYTGVTVINHIGSAQDRYYTFYEKTEVEFYQLSDEEISEYIETGEPMDKAGAYGIQGIGCFLVKGIVGDYFNVMGLPIARIIRILKK